MHNQRPYSSHIFKLVIVQVGGIKGFGKFGEVAGGGDHGVRCSVLRWCVSNQARGGSGWQW